MRTTNVRTNKETEINASHETSKFALTVGITMAGIVGLWGCACMISGLMNGGLVKGLITALTGN
ncbi:MAG: hypothetical protein ABIJ50_13290 [Pseudomonadota bacterium]